MKLYHGTSAKHYLKILRHGLKPRGEGGATNWEDQPSHPDMAYLTTAYPLYFAAAASDMWPLLVLEVDINDLDVDKLYPDEDVIAQSLSIHEKRPLEEVQDEVVNELENWKDAWPKALNAMGTVAHQGAITPDQISGCALFDPVSRGNPWLHFTMMEPQISIMNYKICGEYYRELTAWFMGHRADLPLDMSMEGLKGLDPELAAKKQAFLVNQARDRSGIQLIDKENWDRKSKDLQELQNKSN